MENGGHEEEQIRLMPRCNGTPILAVTANAFAEDRARCFESDMNDFISKPVKPEGLYAILLKCLRQSKA